MAWTLIVALLLFGVTVFVHELGHFIAARRMGLVVEKFAIGFGPTLWSFKRDGVQYQINALPLGGYVALPQMAPMDMVEGENQFKREELPTVSPWAKIVTAFWGPAASFLFAVFLACVVWKIGKPDYKEMQERQIGFLMPDGPAAKSGLQAGDTILAINDYPITRWAGSTEGVVENIILSVGEKIQFKVLRLDGSTETISVKPDRNSKMENLRTVGISPVGPSVVDQVLLKSPAAAAGLKKGDKVLAANGQKIWNSDQFANIIQTSKGPVSLDINRDGQMLTLSVTPVIPSKGGEHKPMIGVVWAPGEPVTVWPTPWAQISNSSTLVFRTLKALVSPKSDVNIGHMSGPIGIFDKIMKILRYEPSQLLAFCVIFNVNLALLNMMPIPILDGGHIMFAIIEWIRRRPVSFKVISAVQTAAFIIMIGLFLFISYRDVLRVGKGNGQQDKSGPVEFPESAPEVKN